MSRSYRHTPVCGNTTARSEKRDKRWLNHVWRATVRQRLGVIVRLDDESLESALLPDRHDDVLSTWKMAKDGRQWFGRHEHPAVGYDDDVWPRWKAMGK